MISKNSRCVEIECRIILSMDQSDGPTFSTIAYAFARLGPMWAQSVPWKKVLQWWSIIACQIYFFCNDLFCLSGSVRIQSNVLDLINFWGGVHFNHSWILAMIPECGLLLHTGKWLFMKIPKLHHVWQRTQKLLLGKPSKAATFFVWRAFFIKSKQQLLCLTNVVGLALARCLAVGYSVLVHRSVIGANFSGNLQRDPEVEFVPSRESMCFGIGYFIFFPFGEIPRRVLKVDDSSFLAHCTGISSSVWKSNEKL